MREVETPSVSGLIFLQGDPEILQDYLDKNIKPYNSVRIVVLER